MKIGPGSGVPARDGDVGIYVRCEDPDCSMRRAATSHAHLVRVERADGSIEEVDGDGEEDASGA
jgi:hypothetical protein